MRWTVKLVAEVEPGQSVEHHIASIDRDDRITPTLGLSLAEVINQRMCKKRQESIRNRGCEA